MISTERTSLDMDSLDNNSQQLFDTVIINNEVFFKISDSDTMRSFLMSIVSDSDHWMFISSNGGVSAGRKNSEYALFPYYTDDKIIESSEITGSKSIFWIDEKYLWEPFSIRQNRQYHTTRNLYKNVYGNKIIFEEINHDLKVSFKYEWNSSDVYGFVRKSCITNQGQTSLSIKVVDGIQNIVPYGVPSDTQNRVSNLVDAYKRNQLEQEYGLGIYALSAIIVDKAEPSEALKANIVWSKGLEKPKYLVSSLQLNAFRNDGVIQRECDVKAEKGAYFVNTEFQLQTSMEKRWMIAANVNQDHSNIVTLINQIKTDDLIENLVENDIDLGTKKLIKLNASSDALQLTNDNRRDTRHFANTLFNIMRGGIFDDNYNIEKWDFKNYISKANKKVFAKSATTLNELPEHFSVFFLRDLAYGSSDKNFRRLCLEYMPLKFSRRHGDPSRPWNKFSINTKHEIDGSKVLDYEGNWRDIFQNWEALAHAYPEFVESMIHKFLNATTFDGYNPYRITKDGFDWETIEPDDPWSYIGYWGDHQIIYLLKFLEFLERHKPGKLASFFDEDLFVYANVPYKIKSYESICKNPKDTIEFDNKSEAQIQIKRAQLGADGALLRDKNFFIYKVNFIEKILATVLAKVSNFIPEAGIWLNTQRPEWNDANNALVGNGVSMVTLNYLRRFLSFFNGVVQDASHDTVQISEELKVFFDEVSTTLLHNQHLLDDKISDKDRKIILDGLGRSGSAFRTTIYTNAFSGDKVNIYKDELTKFIDVTLQFLEHSIAANVRQDGMHHAYNLITITDDEEVKISYLDEMLEGQVAALSSGYLCSQEVLSVLDGMKSSALFRPDQYSYLLYPNKDLPRFMEKNNISKIEVTQSDLLKTLLEDGNKQLISEDINGNYHFNGTLNNANSLSALLDNLDLKYERLVQTEKQHILQIYENVFDHKSFTGRSGTFYGYEGLGSIYWHMVSKLVLAVQEACLKAIKGNETDEVVGRLLEHYYEMNEGIGVHKSPQLYGAFPTDPYSHTPAGKGAQQPGMTGQVKEDILSRMGELGVFVKNGQLLFAPCMLKRDEFLDTERNFNYITVAGISETIKIPKNGLVFTYCQVPVIYRIADCNKIDVSYLNGRSRSQDGLTLDATTSEMIFSRGSEILALNVHINPSILK